VINEAAPTKVEGKLAEDEEDDESNQTLQVELLFQYVIIVEKGAISLFRNYTMLQPVEFCNPEFNYIFFLFREIFQRFFLAKFLLFTYVRSIVYFSRFLRNGCFSVCSWTIY